MQTRDKLLLLQIVYAQSPKFDFEEALSLFNAHKMCPEPILDQGIDQAILKALVDPPRRVSEKYFVTDDGLLKLETSCEELYEKRVQELKDQIKANQLLYTGSNNKQSK